MYEYIAVAGSIWVAKEDAKDDQNQATPEHGQYESKKSMNVIF